jgi:CBS domain-containing protein
MNVAEISTRYVESIALSDTLQQAAETMQRTDTGILPVFDEGCLIGTLSERDLAVKACGSGLDPRTEQVIEIYEADPAVCVGEVSVRAALELMRERHQTWLVVIDNEGTVSGVVSLIELLDLLEPLVPEPHDGPEPESVRRVRGREESSI